ncbi:MAG TPA: bifunctional 5,10-methylenetetrahydrofolate dehydrogenase/5,10-methenyltetrahydrofolate cyclohydrolase [Vicinamibacterales bacterium]|nr:bifunctional 5,10-methylenetetrahydrofolate dehydrogenase/5,10-methenyltetrahydrofolate cyclohydrolase [Vicinamibacterales bacterium]
MPSARRLDGAALAAQIREELKPAAAAFAARAGRPPGLALVLVGDDPASAIYVRSKEASAAESGIAVQVHRLPASTPLDDLLDLVARLNQDDAIDGMLVQDPLPPSMGKGASTRVFDTIAPAKDVDGFHPENAGRLSQGRVTLAPCTPSGVIELLGRSDIAMAGADAVVIGRSDIVGKPMAMLLLAEDATVTICHSRTKDLAAHTRRADIVVAAVGRPAFVTPHMVKPGAAVVDVGINRVTDRARMAEWFGEGSPRLAGFDRRGSAVVGDVHPRVEEVAGALTPVPGGVGPLTIAMLLRNTLTAAALRAGF